MYISIYINVYIIDINAATATTEDKIQIEPEQQNFVQQRKPRRRTVRISSDDEDDDDDLNYNSNENNMELNIVTQEKKNIVADTQNDDDGDIKLLAPNPMEPQKQKKYDIMGDTESDTEDEDGDIELIKTNKEKEKDQEKKEEKEKDKDIKEKDNADDIRNILPMIVSDNDDYINNNNESIHNEMYHRQQTEKIIRIPSASTSQSVRTLIHGFLSKIEEYAAENLNSDNLYKLPPDFRRIKFGINEMAEKILNEPNIRIRTKLLKHKLCDRVAAYSINLGRWVIKQKNKLKNHMMNDNVNEYICTMMKNIFIENILFIDPTNNKPSSQYFSSRNITKTKLELLYENNVILKIQNADIFRKHCIAEHDGSCAFHDGPNLSGYCMHDICILIFLEFQFIHSKYRSCGCWPTTSTNCRSPAVRGYHFNVRHPSIAAAYELCKYVLLFVFIYIYLYKYLYILFRSLAKYKLSLDQFYAVLISIKKILKNCGEHLEQIQHFNPTLYEAIKCEIKRAEHRNNNQSLDSNNNHLLNENTNTNKKISSSHPPSSS